MSMFRKDMRKLLCATLVCSSCTISHLPAMGDRPSEPVKVEVDNHEFANLQIYLVRDGIDVLLGRVDGLSQRTFVVPLALEVTTNPIALAAMSLRGEVSLRSPSIIVERGQVISWRIDRVSRGSAIRVK